MDNRRRRIDGVGPRRPSPGAALPQAASSPVPRIVESPAAPSAAPATHPVVGSVRLPVEPDFRRSTLPEFPRVSDAPAIPELPRSWEIPDLARRLGRRVVIGALVIGTVAFLGWRAQAQATSAKETVATSLKVSEQAFKAAKTSLTSGDFAAARDQFKIAQGAIHHANVELAARGQRVSLSSGQTGGTISAGEQFLTSGEQLSASGVALADDLQKIREGIEQNRGDLLKSGQVVIARMDSLQKHLDQTQSRLTLVKATADVYQGSVSSAQLQAAISKIEQAMPQLNDSLATARQLTEGAKLFLGHQHFQQYVLWFQNPAELRATGGFIGTYGRLKLDDGAVKDLKVDSIYAVANQANAVIKEKPPAPLTRFAPAGGIWGMQDANWSPDFLASARQFQKDYEKGGGPTTDGVIALTLNPVVEILKVVGPVEMPEYNYTLSADNFQSLIQQDQQQKSQVGDTDPKKILRDFVPKLLGKIGAAPMDQQVQIAHVIAAAAAAHDLQMTFSDPRLQSLVERYHIDGRLPDRPGFVGLVDTNIAGFKSSTDVETRLDQHLTMAADGGVSGEVTVNRNYSGASSDKPNTTFSRLYLPAGAVVDATDGYNTEPAPVTTEQTEGHTVVGGWVDVEQGATRTYTVRYHLADKVDLAKGQVPLFVRKQAGTAVTYGLTVDLPAGYRWKQPAATPQQYHLEHVLDQDLAPDLSFGRG